ncbi:glutamine--fructose-6-phosphate transaminase (isomerizing) [Candidatus Woesearchaeota archaeon]|nr:glutamine--fructose-6-phosphate transaminase (isomerizing) [Candidatus Woesearchaeota archaeon]
MCGIIAYHGPRNATEIIVKGLKTLEYRGYDSWGVAIKNNDKDFTIKKIVGKITESTDVDGMPKSNIGIGHTRWATHGGVSEKNSHPHLSNSGKIAVVHNGIIENYQEQRDFLIKQGFKFESETDTEIIPNTIEYHMNRGYDFIDAAKRSLNHINGQFAIVVMHSQHNQIVAIRKEAPLVIGVGKKEFFIASDIPAFLDYTKQVIFLEENDLAIIDNEDLSIFNFKENLVVNRKTTSIDWDAEQAKKGDFDHYLMKEISEQADVISKVVSLPAKQIKDITNEIREAQGIFFVACGTSAHSCMNGMYLFSKTAKTHVNFCVASEFEYFTHFLNKKSLVIAISQSGETADTLAAIRVAKERGAKVISIVNVMGSSIMRASHKTILQGAGPEICVLSTKAYTSQIAILSLIAHELAGQQEEGRSKLKELIRYIYYLTSKAMRDHIKELSERLRYTQHIYLIGRGLQHPTALEAALKIKEVSYIHAEAYAGGELKHGTIALIDKGTPCIVFTSDRTEKEIMSNASELKARGAYIIGVGPKNNELFDFYIKVREAEDLNSICQIIPMQILAYQLALLRGCDPDKPRNLAKSVTVK